MQDAAGDVLPQGRETSTGRGGRTGELQRERILAAAAEAIAEGGYAAMSIVAVTTRARVSRGTFYALFSDCEDCFLAVFDEAAGRIAAAVGPAYERERCWRDGIRAGLSSLLECIGDEPELGTLVFVEALGAGPRVLERRAQWLATLIDAVDQGRSEAGKGRVIPRLSAEGVVGAVLSVLHARLLARDRPEPASLSGEPISPGALLGELMAIVVLPYVGQEAAAQEPARALHQDAPKASLPPLPRGSLRLAGEEIADLGARITYRTLRVLTAIAGHDPNDTGPSNREIAAAAGIADQGQTSRLLTRLQNLGLIENTSGPPHGNTNAWRLTPRGAQIERAGRGDSGPSVPRARTFDSKERPVHKS
jgi:AcrR family transcriptional regulator